MIDEKENEHHWKKGIHEWEGERERELRLRKNENRLGGRETRRLLFNDDRI